MSNLLNPPKKRAKFVTSDSDSEEVLVNKNEMLVLRASSKAFTPGKEGDRIRAAKSSNLMSKDVGKAMGMEAAKTLAVADMLYEGDNSPYMKPIFSFRIASAGTFTWICQLGLIIMFLKECLNSYIAHGNFLTDGFMSPVPTDVLVNMGASSVNIMRADNDYFRLFTGPFLHIGVIHVLSNIAVQAMYGGKLEKDWSIFRIMAAFFISAYMGNAWSAIMNPCGATVGSSGGGFGLIGAYSVWVLEHWCEHAHPRTLFFTELIQSVVTLLIGLSGQLDNWAHTLGMITGFLVGTITVERCDFFGTLDSELLHQKNTLYQGINLMHTWPVSPERLNIFERGWLRIKTYGVMKIFLFKRTYRWRLAEIVERVVALIVLVTLAIFAGLYLSDEDWFLENPFGALDLVGPTCVCCWVTNTGVPRFHCAPHDFQMPPYFRPSNGAAIYADVCAGSTRENPVEMHDKSVHAPLTRVRTFGRMFEENEVDTPTYYAFGAPEEWSIGSVNETPIVRGDSTKIHVLQPDFDPAAFQWVP